MASLPDGITLDIPDLRVTITPRSDYIVTIQPVDEYHVVTFDTPTVTRATSIFVDYAQSASYANNVASSSYAEVSATSSYADNFVVAGTVTASQVITGQLTASGLTYPTTDGDAYQIVMTDGAGVLRLDYADRLTLDVKNLDSVQLNKGTPVYIVGFQGDGIYQIAAADASDSDKMPAVGLLADTLAVNDQGHCVLYGALRGIDTQTRSVGDELFVDSGGGLTGSAPSYPALIQKIATVGSVANNGELTILGAGRTNAVPNLATGQIFYGVDNKASTISVTDLLSSNSYIYTGSFTGSFTGDGSGLTGLVSASHALTSDTTISSSYALTASYVANAGVSDWNELTNVPSGLVSSSTQTIANINGQEITPSIISSSGHIVPSTTEIYDLGSTDLRWRDLYLSGSTIYLGSAEISSDNGKVSGSFTGSFTGDASSITGVVSSSYALTASYADNAGASDWSELTNIPSGLVSSSDQVTITESQISDLTHYTDSDVKTKLDVEGVFSSSAQVDYDSIQNVPSGIVSSSGQVDYTGLSNIPSGIVSSSQQINTGSFTGSFSGDGSGLTGITGVGSGVEIRDDGAIRGTAQILDFVDGIDATFASSTASISLNRTGSFTGSFGGDGSGLTSLTADTATSADTASYLNPLQQLVRITGSVDVAQGNLVLDDNAYFLYGTNTSDIAVSLIGVNNSNIVEIGNLGYTNRLVDDVIVDGFVSASSYISASEFSGGGSGLTGVVSASYALSSSYSNTSEWSGLNNIPSGLVSSSSQITITESQISDLTHYTDTDTLDYINTLGVFSSSAQVNADSVTNFDSNVLTYINSLGAISSSTQVDYDSIQNVPSGIVSASSFTSPSQGTVRTIINGVQTDVDTGLQTGDSPQFTNLTLSGNLTVNGTTTYISSSQVDIGDQIITLNANNAAGDGGIYVNDTSTNETGSLLWDVSENYWIAGLLGSESEVITLTSLNAKGVVSSSGQVDYTGLSNVPSGIVSSSTQFTDITAPFTGSFTGSFTGDGSNITGVISSSYATTASYINGFAKFTDGLVVTGSLIASGGLCGIGELSPSYDLDVNGDVRADTYYYDVTSTLQSSSDKRLKTSITPLSSHTEKLLQLNLVDFEWSEEKDNQPSRRERKKLQGVKDRGLIAQEVQEIYPELISEDADGYLTVSYTGLIIPMLKTIQEQQKQIDELKKLISKITP